MRWKISYSPHAAGTDRGDPRDAGEVYACQVFPPLFFQQEGAAILQACYFNDIECYCYKVISDKFGSGSTVEQYQLNLEKCLKKIGEKIPTILKRVYGKER